MIDDPHQLARLLNGTVLAGRAIESVMIEGSDDLPVQHMSAERWNSEIATLVQFGQFELAACK